MKKAYIVILVACWVAFIVVLFQKHKEDDVPITKCIGLHPDLDETRDRFNRDTVRNIVYKNNSSDPQFYAKIVHKIEACDWTKSKKLIKREDVDGDLFALAGSPYRKEALHKKVAFVANDTKFWCVIYDGQDFVVVVLSVWH